MKILALDGSGMTASVALAGPDQIIAEYTVTYKKTHSQTLLPMIEEICRMTELDFDTVDAIAVAGGPGSFTGLRIGSATAKGLALAWKKPVVNVPTLEGLACRFAGTDKLVCPMMDARRQQVYTGLYTFEKTEEGTGLRTLTGQLAVPVAEIIEQINTLGEPVIFLGDGIQVYRDIIKEKTEVPCQVALPSANLQSAACVAMRAFDLLREGKTETGASHRPEYLRKSQAEREREARES